MLSGVLLTGCANTALQGLEQPPQVQIVDIEPIDIGLFEQRYAVTLRIHNPNSVDLPVRGLDYKIALNDENFANGVSGQQFTVPAGSQRLLTLGLISTTRNLLRQLKALGKMSKPMLSYRIEGRMRIVGTRRRLPFDHRGTLQLLGKNRPLKALSIRLGAPNSTADCLQG